MTFSRVKPGNWATGERLTSDQANTLDAKFPDAVDGGAGGTYTPSSALSIADLECPTTPTSGNDVANKTYVDAREAAANAYTDTAESNANAYTDTQISDALASGSFPPTASSATNCTVGTLFAWYQRVGTTVTAHVATSVTSTGSGVKSFRLTLPVDPGANFSSDKDATGALVLPDGSAGYHAVTAHAVSGAKQVLIQWYSTASTGSQNLRGSFSYEMA